MESKNLNDIVIEDNDSSKKAQLKNILTLLALLFIILVISIVITKLILGGDDEGAEATHPKADASTEIIGNNSSTAITTADGLVAGAAAVAVTNNSSDDKSKNGANIVAETKKPLLTERNTTSRKKPTLRDYRAKDVKIEKKPVKRSKDKYVAPKESSSRAIKKRNSANATRGYYIKVGAFKDPTTAINKVKANALRYRKIEAKNGMTTRVLVGPYYSHKDAQNDLAKVKSKITADAYITKIK